MLCPTVTEARASLSFAARPLHFVSPATFTERYISARVIQRYTVHSRLRSVKMRAAYLLSLALFSSVLAAAPERFLPTHRLMGIGVGREDMSDDLLDTRTDLMIQSQTFAIMRESQALAGAKRITGSPQLQALFKSAAASGGMPAQVVEAIAYLESWGDPKAESPAGPRGIMQISAATAATMGLRITYQTRYK